MKPRAAKTAKNLKTARTAKAVKKPKTIKKAKAAGKQSTLSMTPNSSPLFLDPNHLKLAPELAAVPMTGAVADHYRNNPKAAALRAELDSERLANQQSMDKIGIVEPLKVTLSADGTHGKLWDGRHRLEWALARGKDTVPVMHVSEEVGRELMEISVIGRRHWTKGQRAYLAVICHSEVAGVSVGRPKKGAAMSRTELANHHGVSADLIDQAVAVYRAFHAPDAKANSAEAIEAADCKAKYEMSIWAGHGLGAVIAGIGGGKATHNKDRKASGWANLDKPLGTMTRLSHQWDTWAEDERSKALKLMSTRFKDDFSPAFRLALSEALAAADDVLS